MADISSNATKFRSAYVALWELLNSGIATQDWFWYGEVGLYGDGGAEEWRPLLLRKVRQSNGSITNTRKDFASPLQFEMPDFYEGFYKATDNKNVLSVLHAVHVQFGQQQGDHAPLTVFAALNSHDVPTARLRDLLLDRAKKMERLTESRYYVFLSSEHLKAMNAEVAQSSEGTPRWVAEYTTYIKKVMNKRFYKTHMGKASLYPHDAWLFALPIYILQRGRPLLLAIFIIIARGLNFSSTFEADDKRRLWHLGNIDRHLVQLEVQASHILSHRYFSLIDGYVPGSDPIALLAHPSLAKTPLITALRMEGDTHSAAGFGPVFERKDSPLRRAFERSYVTPMELCVKLKIIKNDKTLFGTSIGDVDSHNWPKSLYAHRRERAHLPYEPSVNGSYNYSDESLKALAALIVLLKPKDASLRDAFTNRVFLYPRDSDDLVDRRFHWPVEPGVRFFIPWLNAVRSIADAVKCKGISVLLISGSGKSWKDDNQVTKPCLEFGGRGKLTSKLIKKWIGLRPKDKVRPNGIVVAFACSESSEDKAALERQVQGWTRALLNPFGRRGDDTAPIHNMLLGDIGAVLSNEGLNFPGGDPLFLPLTGSLPIDVDLKTLGKELLLAVTWKVNS